MTSVGRKHLPLHKGGFVPQQELLEDGAGVACSMCAVLCDSCFDFCLFLYLFYFLETKHHLNHCRGFSLLSLLALPHKSPTQTSSKRHRQHKHEVPSKGRKPKGPPSQDADYALRIPDMDIRKGILERAAPTNLLCHSVATLCKKSFCFH